MTKTLSSALFASTVTMVAAQALAAPPPAIIELHDGYNAGQTADERRSRENNNQLGVGAEQCTTQLARQGEQSYLVTVCMGSYTDVDGGPVARIQALCSSVPFDSVAGPDASRQILRYVTDREGNRRRNAHNPKLQTIMQGSYLFLEYGYAPDNNTDTLGKVISPTCEVMSDPFLVKSQNNDNCKADLTPPIILSDSATETRLGQNIECNGNGEDDAKFVVWKVRQEGSGTFRFEKEFDDVQTEPEVERYRAHSALVGPDLVLTCGGAGNTNPPNRGARCALVDTAPGLDEDDRVLWRAYVQRRDDKIYAHDPSPEVIYGSNGQPTNLVYMSWVEIDTRNRDGKEKGRTHIKGAVYQVTRNGMTQMSLVNDQLTSLADSSHPGFCSSRWGSSGEHRAILVEGSIVGSLSTNGRITVLKYDSARNELVREQEVQLRGSLDTGWLSKFYGQNPNNQGRNFLYCAGDVPNPGYGVAGGYMPDVKSFVVIPGTGRYDNPASGEAQDKLSLHLHLVPAEVASGTEPTDPTDPTEPTDPTDPTDPTEPSTPGVTPDVGGCSVGANGAGSLGILAFIGLALLGVIRRRR